MTTQADDREDDTNKTYAIIVDTDTVITIFVRFHSSLLSSCHSSFYANLCFKLLLFFMFSFIIATFQHHLTKQQRMLQVRSLKPDYLDSGSFLTLLLFIQMSTK